MSWVAAITKAERNKGETRSGRAWQNIGWTTPMFGWIKLNSDGSVFGADYRASSGGVLRDFQGRWIRGFARNIGRCSISKAELWGILDGLNLAWEMGFKKVSVEVDSMYAIEVRAKDDIRAHANYDIIFAIKRLLQREWLVTFDHVYREGNRCANAMAAHGATLPIGCFYFDNIIPQAVDIVRQGAMGITYPRLGTI